MGADLGLMLGSTDGREADKAQLFVPSKLMLLPACPRKVETFMGIDQDSPMHAYFEATDSADSHSFLWDQY